MNLKKCVSCGKEQEECKFPSSGWVKGKQYRRKKCFQCYWKQDKKPRRDGVISWLNEYKKSIACANCGNNDFRVLDFHHLSDDKEFNIGEAASKGCSVKKLKAEIDKCQCLCANCHRVVTYEERKRK